MDNVPNIPVKKVEFLAFLIAICTVTAIIVLVVDFQIKGAILDTTNRYYKFRAAENDRAGKARPDFPNGIDTSNHGGIPGYMVGNRATGVEAASDTAKPTAPETNGKRPVRGGNKKVSESDKPVGT